MQKAQVTQSGNKRSLAILIAALAAVYIIWGSTYLGIKYAIETLPSFLMAGARFTIAGALLFAWARFSKSYEKPKFIHWRTSFVVGTLLLLCGNGFVVLAEHHLSSSLAALLIATEPFWIVLIGWLIMKGARPNLKVALGLLLGFVGVALLIGGSGLSLAGDSGQLIGVGLVITATLAWAAGSLYGLRAPTPQSPIQTAGMQMLAGGVMLLLVGTITGEWQSFDPAKVSMNSLLALGYLILFGSVIAFTAYSWLLKNVEPSLASTYAYVNPVIAVLLGWAIAGDTITGQILFGAAIVVGSVALITSQSKEADEIADEDDEKDDARRNDIHQSQVPPDNCKTLSASA